MEVKFAQPRFRRQSLKIELFGHVFRHPIGDLTKLIAGQ